MENKDHDIVLENKLTQFPLINIVIANMIGAGIFATSGQLIQGLHNPILMILLWIVGGGIARCDPYDCHFYCYPYQMFRRKG